MRGYTRLDNNYKVMSKPKWVLWFFYQFWVTAMMISILMLPFVYAFAEIGSSEVVWTDFSPDTEVIEIITDETPTTDPDIQPSKVEGSDSEGLDKEKYRAYFEDKTLVLMVLGGLEYWKLNCGTLSGTGDYFMDLAIKKHNIDIDEMNMDASFQAGLFAATLYNNCDIFLEQVKTIGLGMMFTPTPQEIILDTVSETNI